MIKLRKAPIKCYLLCMCNDYGDLLFPNAPVEPISDPHQGEEDVPEEEKLRWAILSDKTTLFLDYTADMPLPTGYMPTVAGRLAANQARLRELGFRVNSEGLLESIWQ